MITKKQKQEIDFLRKFLGAKNKKEEEENYINYTVKGYKGDSSNSLFLAKRKLDMTIKLWRQDMHDGILAYWELTEDFNCPYADKMIKSICKGLPHPKPNYEDVEIANIAFLNWHYGKSKSIKLKSIKLKAEKIYINNFISKIIQFIQKWFWILNDYIKFITKKIFK